MLEPLECIPRCSSSSRILVLEDRQQQSVGEPDNQQERPLSAWYVTGFIDGEGCFCASIHRMPTRRGWYIGPVVQAYQHRDRVDILERLQAFFGCGKIRPKGPNSSLVTWSVDGVKTIVEKILPHFDRYPLQSGKQRRYTLVEIESGILRGHTPDLSTERKIWSDLHSDVQ